VLPATAKVMELARGLYSLTIGAAPAQHSTSGIATPATNIAGIAAEGLRATEVVGGAGSSSWVGPDGGTVVLRVPATGGHVMITTYRGVAQTVAPVEIKIARLDRENERAVGPNGHAEPATARPAPATPPHHVPTEMVLHIQGVGDRTFPSGAWSGNRGSRLRVEALGVRPLDRLSGQEIEYKAFGPQGRETPWVTDAKLCGSRGRGMPLTGFAVRLVGAASERFDVIYEGAFFDSGVVGPSSNGEPCRAARADDPLEDLRITLVERAI
jgi:hypothetical protein